MDDSLTNLALIAPVLLFSMVAHEYAHGYVAYKNGDPTAYQLGRLTWNPLKHIDPFMTVILPLILALTHAPILGGAKPVPVNPRNYRNYRRGDILVSLAGIVTNIIIAFLCTVLIPAVSVLGRAVPRIAGGVAVLQMMLLYGVSINLVLASFNLIPIPPLDGSHVFKYLLPPGWALAYQRVGAYGLAVILMLLVLGGHLLDLWLAPATHLTALLANLVEPYLLPMPFGS